jgi:hypothetical protein
MYYVTLRQCFLKRKVKCQKLERVPKAKRSTVILALSTFEMRCCTQTHAGQS